MPIHAKRAVSVALTVIGLVLLVIGAWFTVHLGSSGSAAFTSHPAAGSVVVVEPSVLNRVGRATTVTAVGRGGSEVWIGRATPSDVDAVVGTADHTSVTGTRVRSWSLVQSRSGAGRAPALDRADVWRQTSTGRGTVRLSVAQADAPESLVIARPDGSAADLVSVTVTIERRTWFFQALLVSLVGLLATAAGCAWMWHERPRTATSPTPPGPAEGSTPAGPAPSSEEVSA